MPQRQLGASVAPDYVGTVVIGDGSRFITRLVTSYPQAKRLAQRWLQRSLAPGGGGSYTAVLAPVYADGTTGGNATAKTFVQSRARRLLVRPWVGLQAARLLRA